MNTTHLVAKRKKTEFGKTTDYSYDSLGRLAKVLEGERETSFAYDNLSNRTAKTVKVNEVVETALSEVYEYQNNRLASISVGGETTTFGYDQNGNQTNVTKNGISESYGFNGKNQLVSSTIAGGTMAYSYYFNGLRSEKSGTKYIYDGKQILSEDFGATATIYVQGSRLHGKFTIEKEVLENGLDRANPETVGLYQYNSHGDVVKILNAGGVMMNSYSYDAFGLITEKVEAVQNTFFYSGYELDSETVMYYLRSRYYNPTTARFISEDTFNGFYSDPLSLNKYTYCHNNPISYNDPDGEFIHLIAGAVGAAIGGIINASVEFGSQLLSGTDINDINWKAVGASAAEGAIVGGVAGFTMGNPVAIGIVSGFGNAVKQGINKGFDNVDVGEVLITAVVGFAGAGASKVATTELQALSLKLSLLYSNTII